MLKGFALERTQSIDDLLKTNHGKKMTAAEAAILTMAGLNPVAFGLPGGAILPLDAMSDKHKAHLGYILVKNEANATFAAGAFGAVTGVPAFSLVTSGPGFVQSLTGLYDSYMEFNPMVLVSGNVAKSDVMNGKGRAFQAADAVELSQHCSKKAKLVTDPQKLQEILKEAFYDSASHPMGPVHIDIPKQGVQTEEVAFEYFPHPKLNGSCSKVDQKSIDALYMALKTSKKPFAVIGRGAFGARNEVWEFVERFGLPFAYTLKGKGVLPDDHPQNYGLVGMHGKRAVNEALEESDLVIIVGSNGDDRAYPDGRRFTNGRVAVINDYLKNIKKRMKIDIKIQATAEEAMPHLLRKATVYNPQKNLWKWNSKIREKYEAESVYDDHKGLSPVEFLKRANEYLNPDILVMDVGAHQMHGAKLVGLSLGIYNPRDLCANTKREDKDRYSKMVLTSGTAGSMGTSIPYAASAKIARPDLEVLAITGDGGFEMHQEAMWMLTNNNLDIPVLLMNNEAYLQVGEWLGCFHDKMDGHAPTTVIRDGPYGEYSIPNFEGAAMMYNYHHRRLSDPNDSSQALQWLASMKGPRVLEAMISKLGAYPMMPPQATVDKTILHP